MTPQDRLEIAAQAIKEYNPANIDAIDDFSAGDLAKIANDFDVTPENHPRLIGIMIYIRKRITEGLSRVKSFEAAFPERCVVAADPMNVGRFKGGEVGSPLSSTAKDIKAKRLENSQLYLKVYQVLQSNLFVSFAVDRFKVIQEALDKCLDPLVTDRDKAPYMKIFLEETRKPENTKGLEFNLNVTHNELNVIGIEEQMTNIAKKMENMNASDIINMVHTDKVED